MDKVDLVNISARRRIEAYRAILITLVDTLADNGTLDRDDFIGSLDALVQIGRQTNEASETIEELRLLAEGLQRPAEG